MIGGVSFNQAFRYAVTAAALIAAVCVCTSIYRLILNRCSEDTEENTSEPEDVEVTVEDISSINNTVKQSTDGVAVVGGKIAMYSRSPTSINETKYYAYIRDASGNLYQCTVDVDTFAALSVYKGKTIRMKRLDREFYWNNMTITKINTLESAEETNT